MKGWATRTKQGDDRLFQAGDAEAVDDACRHSAVGKLLPNALYVHRGALESLDPLLRVYEGCARAYLVAEGKAGKASPLTGGIPAAAAGDPWPEILRFLGQVTEQGSRPGTSR